MAGGLRPARISFDVHAKLTPGQLVESMVAISNVPINQMACMHLQVVGRFELAGAYLGKEDFSLTRVGHRLRVKGNPNNDPQSYVCTYLASAIQP